jgi:hypothetical protein
MISSRRLLRGSSGHNVENSCLHASPIHGRLGAAGCMRGEPATETAASDTSRAVIMVVFLISNRRPRGTAYSRTRDSIQVQIFVGCPPLPTSTEGRSTELPAHRSAPGYASESTACESPESGSSEESSSPLHATSRFCTDRSV